MASLAALVERQGGKCYYCKEQMTSGRMRPTKDHVLPRARGGHNGRGNLVAACQSCNSHKADMSAHEFVDKKLPVVLEDRRMTRRQKKAIKRLERAKADKYLERRKDVLRAVDADMRYAAKSTAWAEPLAALLERMNAERASLEGSHPLPPQECQGALQEGEEAQTGSCDGEAGRHQGHANAPA